MNCYLHPETPATAFCRTCGRSLCAVCQRPAEGTIYCQDHVPVAAYSAPPGASDFGPNPYAQPGPVPPAAPPVSPAGASPVLAFLLGFIPGVGAIYNGQYLKGLMHALIAGLLITIVNDSPGSSQPLGAMVLAAFLFYMPFEAYHTARRRRQGLQPEEWSSILPRGRQTGRAPVGPILLIAVGVLYLLQTMQLIDFHQISRYWPVLLILAGAYMLYTRVSPPPRAVLPPPDGEPYSNAASAPGRSFAGTRHE